ncbi:MAG: LysR family transcriptional regulator [Bacillota bacterium]|nr:LysR family transcriptional regulator [Bacillota bacterium]
MSLVKYQLLLSAVEKGSITGAVEEMGYTQSGVSHMLNSLEEELGVVLINRSRSGVTLTSAGELLLPQIKRIVADNEVFMQTVSGMNGMIYGKIVIGTFPEVTSGYLPEIIGIFTGRYPRVQIEIKHGTQTEIEEWIEQGKADCGFIRTPESAGLRHIPVYRDRLVAVCGKERMPEIDSGEILSAECLKANKIILGERTEGFDYRKVLKDAGGKTDILHAGNGHGAVEWVKRVPGIGIVSVLYAGNQSGIKVFELENTGERTISFAYSDKRKLPPAGGKLAEIIENYGRDSI